MSDEQHQFATTCWTQILAAGGNDSSVARASLEQLCGAYWYPLYAFARQSGQGPENAQDLTQGFFCRLLENNYLAQADREKGRFRTFMLSAFKHFMAKEWRREQALKRGGDREFISIDGSEAEHRYGGEMKEDMTPDRIFERKWAITILDRTLSALREEYHDSGREAVFEQLKEIITTGTTGRSYADIADTLDLKEGAVKVAAHRLRQRYRDTLRHEIAQTVGSEDDIDEELNNLSLVLRG
ncbi:MAG: RNA polymerase sigma factor [Limisphaerales bacterium]